MIGKPKDIPKPKMPQSVLDSRTVAPPEETSSAYKSLISTASSGLTKRASGVKKTLLGGIR